MESGRSSWSYGSTRSTFWNRACRSAGPRFKIGVNWYANRHVKVMVNLGVFAFDNGGSDGDGSEAGLRVEFAF